MNLFEINKIKLDYNEYSLLKYFWELYNKYDFDDFFLSNDLTYFDKLILEILEEYSYLIDNKKNFEKRSFD